MSDSGDSIVTYTEVSSLFEGLSYTGSPGVDGLPMMPQDPYAYMEAALQAPPSPDYVLGPEHPPTPEFVLEHVYLEFMPLEDDILPAKEQTLPAAVSPSVDSPGYIPESDPKKDHAEDHKEDDEDPEEDPAGYPTDRDDDDDDEANIPEVTLSPQKRLCIALGLRYEVGESSFAPTAIPTGDFRADYGFVGTLDDEIRRDPERGRL
nr:hypothetical protein [Tanacetum cinerariifolium]GEZ34641.1 hypothetical protein [Tanacetum cinerariifolium]